MTESRLGRRRLADMMLAGTLLASGVTELVTCDADGFRCVEGLATVDPLTR